MASDPWIKVSMALRNQLKPYGYCGHLLSFLQSKKKHLEDIVKRTALMSESNSVLIMGPIGSGKSALLENVIDTVYKIPEVKDNMLHVALDGLLHVDDNIALEDITRQLSLGEVEDKSLGNFSEKLRLLLAALKGGSSMSKSVLFVLDNFELFCSHKNQNLLYNLFDIAQSQQTPICVIGMCSRPDVIQVLENRVNSRFSHQKILLYDEITFSEYVQAAEEILSLSDLEDQRLQKRWNADISKLFKEQSVSNALQQRFNSSKTIRDLKELLSLVVQNLDPNHTKLTIEDFEEAYKDSCQTDSNVTMMLGLSVLEISLIVSMMHLTEIYDGEPFNFEIVFNELGKFLRNRMKWNIEKPIVMKAFEHLMDLELVKSAIGDASTYEMKRYVLVRLLVTPDKVRETVDNYQHLPSQIRQWATSAIDG